MLMPIILGQRRTPPALSSCSLFFGQLEQHPGWHVDNVFDQVTHQKSTAEVFTRHHGPIRERWVRVSPAAKRISLGETIKLILGQYLSAVLAVVDCITSTT
jgi:hypothetical protein